MAYDPVTDFINGNVSSSDKMGAIAPGGDLLGDRQANLMREQAALKLGAFEESMRRAQGMQTQVLSSTKARMAGSGFSTGSGSYSDYIHGMASEFDKQNKMNTEFAAKDLFMSEQAASMTASANSMAGLDTFIGFGTSGAKMMFG
jgi:hypothetical protein